MNYQKSGPMLVDITPSTIEKFLNSLEFFFSIQKVEVEDHTKVGWAAQGLGLLPELSTWWEGASDEFVDISWDTWKDEFRKRAIPGNYLFNTKTRVRNMKQGNEEVDSWIRSLRECQSSVGKKVITDLELAREMIYNMDGQLQTIVRKSEYSKGTGLNEKEIALLNKKKRQGDVFPVTVLLPFEFRAFEEFIREQWDIIKLQREATTRQIASSRAAFQQQRQALVNKSTSSSSQYSTSNSRTSSRSVPPSSSSSYSSTPSSISNFSKLVLTPRQISYLKENRGCFKCCGINLEPINGLWHSMYNCNQPVATVGIKVPSEFVPRPPRINTQLAMVEIEKEMQEFNLESSDGSISSDEFNKQYKRHGDSEGEDECVDLSFPSLKIRLDGTNQSFLIDALADTGASSSFISNKMVDALGLERLKLRVPRRVKLAIKGGDMKALEIKHYTFAPLSLANGIWSAGTTFFKIADLEGRDVILGNPFLFKHKITLKLHPFPQLLRITETYGEEQDLLAKVEGPSRQGHALPRLPRETEKERLEFEEGLILAKIEEMKEEYEEKLEFERRNKEMREEFKDVFPENIPDVRDDDENYSSVRHHIKLINPTVKHNQRGYAVPHKFRPPWRTLLDQHLAAGRMRGSSSQYAAPSFIIPKKDMLVLPRWLNDFRKLNANTVKDRTPLPLPDEILGQCAKARFWGKLDMTNSFFQTRMAEEDIEKTAVRTPWGLFEWVVMPMGLCNAPATHQRRVNEALGELNGTICYAYIDDIIIFADTLEEHTKNLRLVLEALRKARLYCSPKKTELYASEVSFLGHVIGRKGLSPDQSKVDKIINWPVPKTVKQLRGFLGLVQYLRKFIVGLATHTAALTVLVKKHLTSLGGLWKEEQEEHFNAIKKIVTSLPCLKPLDYSEGALPVFVMTDASNIGIGAVLLQGKDWKTAHPIGYYSRQYIPAERHYPTHEQEMLAVVAALKHWRIDLLGAQFTALSAFSVLTDHQTLTRFPTQPHQSKRQARWTEFLADYDFDIKYLPGDQNTVADALSRYGFEKSPYLRTTLNVVSTVVIEDSVLDKIKLGYTSDPFCVTMIRNLRSTPSMTLVEGLLYNEGRLVIPKGDGLREVVLHDTHDVLGHLGLRKTYQAVQKKYYWPLMRKEVRDYVKTCDGCQRNKSRTTRATGKLHTLPVPLEIMTDVSIDFVGPLPLSGGFDTLMTMTCRLSGYVRLIPCGSRERAKEIARRFYESWFRLFGMPERMVTDRDKLFVSKFWKSLHQRLGIKLQMSTAFHPETDGRSERTNKTAVQILRYVVSCNQTNWVDKLAETEFSMNAMENVSTGRSPFEMVLGYLPSLVPSGRDAVEKEAEGVEEVLEERRSIQLEARDTLLAAKVHQAEQANAGRGEEIDLEVGDQVMIDSKDRRSRFKSKGVHRAAKFFPRWDGPYKVVAAFPEQSLYQLELGPGDKSFNKFHISKLKKYFDNNFEQYPDREPERPAPVIVGGEDEYIVEEVVEEKAKGRGRQYLVKWQGYPEMTWENRAALNETEALDKWERRGE